MAPGRSRGREKVYVDGRPRAARAMKVWRRTLIIGLSVVVAGLVLAVIMYEVLAQ